ncbi:DUF1223 domain-containing protein [Pedobacter mendelii]|uniref:DUF1223 domain-containing protein n=1 Tax=Pedobacter mendelii TaxID=1908240 RepID=A0ABQ2BDQ5_9SPHI|nr:DUF1223 domain-containing protein [Pedobacter mendelii]GGI23750.1 hypothetical protein GCM10008119_09220 [Pedobacter mendelii]
MSRKIALILISICTISIAFATKRKESAPSGFAVVELFTSEGCSSCPPADALVARIEKENQDRPVYILAYHVDYWDRLGWKDTFSNRIFSQRQNQYAKWLNLSSVYTPQIVINGSKEFVGSEEKTLRGAITSSLSEAGKTKLAISLSLQSGQNIIDYQINQPTLGYNLLVAIITPNASNKIERGENKGRTLSHVQIVRSLENFSLNGKDKGSVNFLPAKGIQQGSAEIIALLQNEKTGQITAAAKLKF